MHKTRKIKKKGRPKLVIAGIHGDERTAPEFLRGKRLKDTIIIANMNPSAYNRKSRYDNRGIDMNRMFGKGEKLNMKTQKVEKLIKERKVSLVVDFHESKGFYGDKSCKSRFGPCLGNSIIPSQKTNKKLLSLANKIIKNLRNKPIGKTYKIGKASNDKHRGTLREYSKKHLVPYLLIEVAKPQDRSDKIKQIKEIIKTVSLSDF